MWDLPQFADGLERTRRTGKIKLTGAIEGLATVTSVTGNIEEALKDASVIFIVARSNVDTLFAQAEICIDHRSGVYC
jgi:hypothetical protein